MMDLEFETEPYVGVTSMETTYHPGPTPAQQFAQDPTSYLLIGIFVLLALGLVAFLRRQ